MVVGAFTFCYLPGFICLLITATIGLSRVPNEVKSAVVVMVVISSALNPIIYMIRSNEFQRGFKRIFLQYYSQHNLHSHWWEPTRFVNACGTR